MLELQPEPESIFMHVTYLHRTGEASGGVHGVQEVAARDAATHHRILRASVPGQVLRRGGHSGRAVGEVARGRDQLQLQVTGGFGAVLCQCGLQLRLGRRHQAEI